MGLSFFCLFRLKYPLHVLVVLYLDLPSVVNHGMISLPLSQGSVPHLCRDDLSRVLLTVVLSSGTLTSRRDS